MSKGDQPEGQEIPANHSDGCPDADCPRCSALADKAGVGEQVLAATLTFFTRTDGRVLVHLSQGLETVGPIGGSYRAGDAADRKRLLLEVVDVLTGAQGERAGWKLP
jgi:hypothetical protein